jgi:hypothetical protein
VRSGVLRWAKGHPNTAAVLTVAMGIGLAAFAVARLVQEWTGVLSFAVFVLGAVAGGLTAWLSYQAAYVQRWQVSPQMQTTMRTLQGVSAAAAFVAVYAWGPKWLIACAAGFVFVLGVWLVPTALLGRRLRLADPHAADELYERSQEVMRG